MPDGCSACPCDPGDSTARVRDGHVVKGAALRLICRVFHARAGSRWFSPRRTGRVVDGDGDKRFYRDVFRRTFDQAAGATVIAAASTPDKLQVCRDSGADMLLNYRERSGDERATGGKGGSWRGALKRLVGERGIDVVVDNVGGADCEASEELSFCCVTMGGGFPEMIRCLRFTLVVTKAAKW